MMSAATTTSVVMVTTLAQHEAQLAVAASCKDAIAIAVQPFPKWCTLLNLQQFSASAKQIAVE